ncbi:hypothetical protein ACERZ8_04905 [Tateyamaria armeniaca]|uniref:DUF2975 domain-containing protein n=1 Tax=Tateyamaria armeniaca TaxID=2518930 RepID=A0ABW8UTG8_9RHOB
MMTDKISHRARWLSYLAMTCFLVLPLGALALLATGGVNEDALRAHYAGLSLPEQLGTTPVLIWAGVEATKMALLLWVIWCLRTWLVACAQGEVFAATTARLIRRMGIGLLTLAGVSVIDHTIVVAALTWGNPAGQRSLAVGFGSSELFLFLTAGLVALFGWIQAEAARISAENEAFV